MTMAPVYIHVGFPKTATTWLQNRVFPHHPDFRYGQANQILDGLQDDEGVEPRARERLEDLRQNSAKPVLLSLEGLTGLCLPSASDGATQRDPRDIAASLKRIAPDARILITIREQADMIESSYLQYIFGGYTASPKQALADNDWNLKFLDYSSVVRAYEDLFGADNVWVGLYEKLGGDKLGFLDDIWSFMNVSRMDLEAATLQARDNLGISRFMLRLILTFNRLIPNRRQMHPKLHAFFLRNFKRADKLIGGRNPGSRWETAGAVDMSIFAPGNRELEDKRGLGLKEYGYRL